MMDTTHRIFHNKSEAIKTLIDYSKELKRNLILKKTNGHDEYSILEESEVADIHCDCYVARYNYQNAILTALEPMP